ncbi:leucine-rich repeat, cysteine-containing subtype protein [Tanacetum coccineum]
MSICGSVVNDEDRSETLDAKHVVMNLRSLKDFVRCKRVTSGWELKHVSKYCNRLRTLCLGYARYIDLKDGIWLHQLALNSTVLEMFSFKNMKMSDDAEDLTLLAKNCCNSLISLKIGKCYLSKLGDAFRYAVRLEHFGGYIRAEESELVGFKFPTNMRSLSIHNLAVTRYSIVFPFLNHIRKLKLLVSRLDNHDQCLLFERCPNLEVLSTQDVCGDRGLEVIGMFCKKLRKLTYYGTVTHMGLIALAKGCTKLEYLKVWLEDISNEALECVGTHLKNLRDFHISDLFTGKEDNMTDFPLENGVRAMLMGCRKLERLDITLLHGGLTDVGLEYIGKYGANLRSLSLTHIGESDAGLVKLSKGCPKLRS